MKHSIKMAMICLATSTCVWAQFNVTWDNCKTHGYGSTQLTVNVNKYSTDSIVINGKEYLKVYLPGGGSFAIKGQPDLPDAIKPIIIPDDRQMQVTVTDSQYTDIAVSGIVPSRGAIFRNSNPDTIPYTFGSEYNTDAWFPQNIAELSKPFIYRDFRGTIAKIFPFQYNPVKKILRVYSKISVNASAVSTDSINVFSRTSFLSSGIDAEYNQYYKEMFLNYSITHYTILTEDGSMLVIAPASLMSAIMPLVEWKRKKGLKVDTASLTTIGSTAADIKSYISSAYNATGSALKYVLLVGDASEIPTPVMDSNEVYSSSEISSGADIRYGEIVGSDCYSELLIGRFSGATAPDIKTQVDRSIYYETGMKTTDTWLSRVLLTAYDNATETNAWGETDADFINHEYDTLLAAGYTSSTALRYNRSAYCGSDTGCFNAKAGAVTAVLDSGVAFWNYSDHGSKIEYLAASFDTADAAGLDNTNRYFYTYAVACNVGKFATGGGNCLAEALMKSQRNGNPAGCVGCYLGSIEQDWDPPYASVREILEISLQRYTAYNRYTLGGVMINGGMKAYEVRSDDICRGIVDSYVLFGDPNLQIYTTTPKAMTISHADTTCTGAQTITVNGSVDGARVCIYNGKEGIQSVGTISSGTASLTVAPAIVGDTLYVT
ncbi:MAG TPA: hypothetical protein DCO75_07345, partial [Fibrobacteres bacterium]|nr:hypothetical protein [Fibrobacterota bacterium]